MKSEVNQEIQARTPSTCGSRRQSLTPLGFLSKPALNRRLSEAFLDVQKAMSSPHKSKIKRTASEITWRSTVNSQTDTSPTQPNNISQTTSYNTLQVPKEDDEELAVITSEEGHHKFKINFENKNPTTLPKNIKTANLLLQKFFGLEVTGHTNKKASAIQTVLDASPKRSPRILITRAFSEESDKSHSGPPTPSKDINKKHSSSATTLLERKWRQLRYKEEDVDRRCDWNTTKPLLENNGSCSNKSSDSSDASEISCGRLFMTLDAAHGLDTESESTNTEEQSLLSWPAQLKSYRSDEGRRAKLAKGVIVQTEEVIL